MVVGILKTSSQVFVTKFNCQMLEFKNSEFLKSKVAIFSKAAQKHVKNCECQMIL